MLMEFAEFFTSIKKKKNNELVHIILHTHKVSEFWI